MLMLSQISVSQYTPSCDNQKEIFRYISCSVPASILLTEVIAPLFVYLATTAPCHTFVCSGMRDN